MNARTILLAALLTVSGLYGPAPIQGVPRDAGTSASALWEPPASLREQDLFNGPWGPGCAPDPKDTYTFLRYKQGGVNPGVVVRDSRGRVWHVKQAARHNHGDEGPVEVALSRVLSAVGFHQPPVYFLPSFRMTDGSGTHVERGGRFRLELPSLKPRGNWEWKDNPYVGTRPYNGLLVMLLIFNSWDLKDSNNTVYDVERGGRQTQWYVVRDLGGALGESGTLSPIRNDIKRFERQRYVSGVNEGFVRFAYKGKHTSLVEHITVEDVQWADALLMGLDDRQWHDAFRAGGYPRDLADRFIRKIQANIARGEQLANPAWRFVREGR